MTAPTLLIGLGGTGSKIICKVANLVTEEQRQHIGFAVFDTDINELRDIQAANPFIRTIQTSTKMSVGEYLNIDTHARDGWFPVNPILNSKTLTEGAGQVRAVSRLAFDTALRAGNLEPLHEAIEDLYKIEENHAEQSLRIIIVSSLAGGTGSGLILPVALYTRNYLSTRYHQSANITRGFFILPEVFYKVIRGEAERNNLKCNAYATLRELDAFMMKGDGTLPEQYEDTFKLEFPRIGSEEFEEYNIRPYDFCFLFDAQNTNDLNLNDFNQYLDHAANCIYSQSIGPINKRSNSSEDNTIRKLCAERGRNRYAGAGCSMLVYPVDDIQKYVALKWANDCISDEWLKFDKLFIKKRHEFNERKKRGIFGQEPDPRSDYVQIINDLTGDPFANLIRSQCVYYNIEDNTRTNNWDEYVKGIQEYVERYDENRTELNGYRYDASSAIESLSGNGSVEEQASDLRNAYDCLIRYYRMAVNQCDGSSRDLAYTMFNAQGNVLSKEKYLLETYLRDPNDNFIHPNAVRYFLYQSLSAFERCKREATDELNDVVSFIKNYNPFDDGNATNGEETVENFEDYKFDAISKISILAGKTPDYYKKIRRAFSDYIPKVDEYRRLVTIIKVYEEGIEYIKKLCKAFQNFYLSFEGKVLSINRILGRIERKYVNNSGRTTRYVCASQNCLDKLSERVAYQGSSLGIDSDLAKEIYVRIRSIAMDDSDEDSVGYSVIFDDTILTYFIKQISQTYGDEVNMDVITALEREAEFEGYSDEASQEAYISKVMRDMRVLSTPFIERPLGEQVAPIAACTYHPSIDPGDDSPRSMLLARELKNFGGIPDEDIPRTEVMFYQSIYGLRANQLSKFAPADPGQRGEGEYYKSYYEVINRITPKSDKTPVVTPHIDKTWHVITVMPDLDENNQKSQENRIYRAFFLYLLWYKTYPNSRNRRNLYRILLKDSNPEDFVVSNGTPCDNYYEILDALTINPVMVQTILSDARIRIDKEINNTRKADFKTSKLYRALNELELKEFSARAKVSETDSEYAFNIEHASIFDIVTLMRLSTPSAEFSNRKGCDILRSILELVYNYMKRMTAANELDEKFGEFIRHQYYRFVENKPSYDSSYYDLIGRLIGVVHGCLEELELDDIAEEIREDARRVQHWL